MGLGKTLISILAAQRAGAKEIVVLCPSVAKINWTREFLSNWIGPVCPVTVVSYSMVAKELPPNKAWDVAILDEAHFLKNLNAQRTKLVLGTNGVLRAAKKIWCLTGTPAPNHAGELWAMLYTFGVTKLKYEEFVSRFCTGRTMKVRNQWINQITGTKKERIPELRELLSTFMLRRRKEDVIDLPKITFERLWVEAGPVDVECDSSFVKYTMPKPRVEELFAQLEKERDLIESVLTNGRGGKLLEHIAPAIPTLRRWIGLQKVDAIAHLIDEELGNGLYDKIVIFALHQGVIEGLRVRLERWGAVTLYGGTPPEKRQKHIDDFQKNSGKPRVFIGNILAAGTAITLTAANQILFAELDYVPANNAQAAMRCHRIGQTKPVTVRMACLPDSIDERVTDILKRKSQEIAQLIDGAATDNTYTVSPLDAICR